MRDRGENPFWGEEVRRAIREVEEDVRIGGTSFLMVTRGRDGNFTIRHLPPHVVHLLQPSDEPVPTTEPTVTQLAERLLGKIKAYEQTSRGCVD